MYVIVAADAAGAITSTNPASHAVSIAIRSRRGDRGFAALVAGRRAFITSTTTNSVVPELGQPRAGATPTHCTPWIKATTRPDTRIRQCLTSRKELRSVPLAFVRPWSKRDAHIERSAIFSERPELMASVTMRSSAAAIALAVSQEDSPVDEVPGGTRGDHLNGRLRGGVAHPVSPADDHCHPRNRIKQRCVP